MLKRKKLVFTTTKKSTKTRFAHILLNHLITNGIPINRKRPVIHILLQYNSRSHRFSLDEVKPFGGEKMTL